MRAMPRELDPEIVNWWPRHPETNKLMYTLRHYGLFRLVYSKAVIIKVFFLTVVLKSQKFVRNCFCVF
jgi:hypothetical protein